MTDTTGTGDLTHNISTTEGLPPPPSSDTLVTETSPPTAEPTAAESSIAVGDLDHGEADDGAVGGKAVGQGDGDVINKKVPSRSSSRDRKPSTKAIENMLDQFNGSIEKLRLHINKAHKLIADSDDVDQLRAIRELVENCMETVNTYSSALIPHLTVKSDIDAIRAKVEKYSEKTDDLFKDLNSQIWSLNSEQGSHHSSGSGGSHKTNGSRRRKGSLSGLIGSNKLKGSSS